MSGDLGIAARRKGSFGQTVRAVAWSFFGVRRSADQDKDLSEINPVHVIIAGIVGALLFIAALIGLVNWIIGSGVAG
jgi:hypothetical protein